MKEELRKFIYDVQEKLLLEHIKRREENFRKAPDPNFYFSNRPNTPGSSNIDNSNAEDTSSGDEDLNTSSGQIDISSDEREDNSSDNEDSRTSSPMLYSPIDIPCRQEELRSACQFPMSVNVIDFGDEYEDDDAEKELVAKEIDRLLYRPKTLLVFCDASFNVRSKQYSGAAAIYLSNKNNKKEYVKLTSKVIIRGYADNNNHAEVLTANEASKIANSEIRKWFQNGVENPIESHEDPDKIVVYCDNMIPVNVFRWLKHNDNYTTRTKKNFSGKQDSKEYQESLIECHNWISNIFQLYFKKPCKHMNKKATFMCDDQDESYMFELISIYKNQLRTDQAFNRELDCFDEFTGGFDIRHCPGHSGIVKFDEVDLEARTNLRVAKRFPNQGYSTRYKNIIATFKETDGRKTQGSLWE